MARASGPAAVIVSGTEARAPSGACHAPASGPAGAAHLRVVLVGAPNVGKSALFNRLTGGYVTVSNYPGTSVEVSRGRTQLGGRAVDVLDTPGIYSLITTTEEERVTRRVVLDGGADVLVHVLDAKNVARQLSLSLQLLETGTPLVLGLNMMDEARRVGLDVRAELLARRLGVAVVPLVATRGEGVDALRDAIVRAVGAHGRSAPAYANGVGDAIRSVREKLAGIYPVDPAALAALLLQSDAEATATVASAEYDGGGAAIDAARAAAGRLDGPAVYRIAYERQRAAEALAEGVVAGGTDAGGRLDAVGRALSTPLIGFPVLLVVLYLGLYQFVGVFGAGTVVDWLETGLFEGRINPLLEAVFLRIVPWDWLRSLFVGEYGVLTLGVRYAVAIVLPIVGAFFLFFSVLEDSGYFPRLALLVDRSFKRIGLSGRAVIPMVLGFACDTMATMVTRTLETRRERVLATLLLALAIPCSAQLGVILAILAGQPAALAVWTATLVGTFLLVGALGARVLPGERATFHMELPPLRLPRAGNVLVKTASRMQWYFLEVLPLFLLASVLLWALDLTRLLGAITVALGPLVHALGLPAETARIFLFGFFRRDYGAAGLFDLHQAGALDMAQLTVAAVTLTLFLPCVAQFLMMLRERGARVAFGMLAFITPFAFGVGFLLNLLLRGVGW